MTSIDRAEPDVLAPEVIADPYPFFARMREVDPVHWSDRYRAWFVYRYEDVFAALRDPAYSSDRVRPVYDQHLSEAKKDERRPTFDVLLNWMVFMDPPDHTRLRRLVMPAFSPRAIEAWRPKVEEVVRDTLASLGDRDRIDLVSDFAYPIPAVVIAALMGVPAQDRDKFKHWSDEILTLVFGAATSPDRRMRAQNALVELSDYLRAHIALLKSGDAGMDGDAGTDVISALMQSDVAEPPLNEQELVSTCVLLIFGGHETTTNFLANGIRALVEHPDQLALLRTDPTLLRSTVEELLRYDGPSKMVMRRLESDVVLQGRRMRAGDNVYLVQGSANRDPSAFADPDRLDITRSPNRHVAFGFGIHHCLGNILARVEGAVGLEAFINTYGTVEADSAHDATWIPTLISRGMHSMPVRVSR